MVSVQKISIGELPALVSISFNYDDDLVDKYHCINGDIDNCVIHTVQEIYQTSMMYKLRYYKVLINKEPVGYFVIGKLFLYSFAINIKYRKREVLLDLWSKIVKEIGNSFFCMLYNKNERAINFLKKQGMIVRDQGIDKITLTTI